MTQTSLYAIHVADDEALVRITVAGISGWLGGEEWVSTISPGGQAHERSLTWLRRAPGRPMRILGAAVWDVRLEQRWAAA